MVRAQVFGHLDALKSRFPELLGGLEILDSGGTDYAHRFFVAKPAWTQVVAELAEETDYDNLKSEPPLSEPLAQKRGGGIRPVLSKLCHSGVRLRAWRAAPKMS